MNRSRAAFMMGSCVLAAALAAVAPASAVEDEAPVAWGDDYELALEEALLTRRPVLLTFYATWCGWCRRLERETFRYHRFVEMSRSLVPVRVDGEREKGLAALFQVRGYPLTLVLSREGRVLARIDGYHRRGQFLGLVRGALEDRAPAPEVVEAAAQRPEDPEAAYALGDALLGAGAYAEAREAFRRAGDLSAAGAGRWTAAARLDEALTRHLAGEHEAALPLFEDYLARFPGDDRRDVGLYFYGRALIGAGRSGEGRDRIEEAAERTAFRFIRREAERLRSEAREEGHGG